MISLNPLHEGNIAVKNSGLNNTRIYKILIQKHVVENPTIIHLKKIHSRASEKNVNTY